MSLAGNISSSSGTVSVTQILQKRDELISSQTTGNADSSMTGKANSSSGTVSVTRIMQKRDEPTSSGDQCNVVHIRSERPVEVNNKLFPSTNISTKCFTTKDLELMVALIDNIGKEMPNELVPGMVEAVKQFRMLISKLNTIERRDGSAYASLRKLGTEHLLKMKGITDNYKDEIIKAVVIGNIDDLILLFKGQ